MLLAVSLALLAVPAYDWLLVTEAARRMPSIKIRYWRLTTLRWVSLTALMLGTFATCVLVDPPGQRIWVGLPWLGAMFFHGVVVVTELVRQRRVAQAEANVR